MKEGHIKKLRMSSKKHRKHRVQLVEPQVQPAAVVPGIPQFEFTVKNYDVELFQGKTRRCITDLMQAAALSNDAYLFYLFILGTLLNEPGLPLEDT